MHDDDNYKRERKEYVRSELRLYKSYIPYNLVLLFWLVVILIVNADKGICALLAIFCVLGTSPFGFLIAVIVEYFCALKDFKNRKAELKEEIDRDEREDVKWH
ncbi:hypothetical protein DWW62_08255 [Clostridium sp. AF16-25]|nr:hypothetical protein DWW62_08255 [Clostridium sp. AF16-25]RGH04926.1 hypothetical protein DWW48_03755 [Clostridium sp. AF15-49]